MTSGDLELVCNDAVLSRRRGPAVDANVGLCA